MKNEEKGKKNYPCLYEAFELGDRVKRIYTDNNGSSKVYKGIILAIEKNNMEVYWDTLDGKYRPKDMNIAFTTCTVEEIFKGNEYYSPIKRD